MVLKYGNPRVAIYLWISGIQLPDIRPDTTKAGYPGNTS